MVGNRILILESSYLTGFPWGGSAREAKSLAGFLSGGGYAVKVVKGVSFGKVLFTPPKADLVVGIGSPFFGGLVSLLGLRMGVPVIYYLDHLRHFRKAFGSELELIFKTPSSLKAKLKKVLVVTRANLPILLQLDPVLLPFLWRTELVFASRYLREQLGGKFGLGKCRNFPVAYPIFLEDLERRGRRRNSSGRYILYYGGLLYKRGVGDLLAAFEKLIPRYPDLRLTIAGHPVQKETVDFIDAVFSRNRELRKRTCVLGKLSQEDLFELVDGAALVALPFHFSSTVQPPLTVAEAMVRRKVILTTDVGACQELIGDGKSGLFCAPKDPESLAKKISWVLENPSRAREMGQRAREEILQLESRSFLNTIEKLVQKKL